MFAPAGGSPSFCFLIIITHSLLYAERERLIHVCTLPRTSSNDLNSVGRGPQPNDIIFIASLKFLSLNEAFP